MRLARNRCCSQAYATRGLRRGRSVRLPSKSRLLRCWGYQPSARSQGRGRPRLTDAILTIKCCAHLTLPNQSRGSLSELLPAALWRRMDIVGRAPRLTRATPSAFRSFAQAFDLVERLALGEMKASRMVRPARFERATSWFVARRSIQLSYGRDRLLILAHHISGPARRRSSLGCGRRQERSGPG